MKHANITKIRCLTQTSIQMGKQKFEEETATALAASAVSAVVVVIIKII